MSDSQPESTVVDPDLSRFQQYAIVPPVGDRVALHLGGREYRWSGWFGCQLESTEWRRPPAGTEREIVGVKFRVFSTARDGLKVRCTWCMTGMGRHIDDDNAKIRALKGALASLI